MDAGPALGRGEEFRDDLRPLAVPVRAGQGNAAARRVLSAEELAPLTQLNDARSLAAVALTIAVSGAAIAFGAAVWPSPWVLLAVLVVGVQQHGFFILAHESAHYRLLGHRGLHPLPGAGTDPVGPVQHVGDGAEGDAGGGRDVLDGHRAGAGHDFPPAGPVPALGQHL